MEHIEIKVQTTPDYLADKIESLQDKFDVIRGQVDNITAKLDHSKQNNKRLRRKH